MNTRLRMSDIARLAGVSPSTVSRAFNNSPSIPAETRERILKIAQAHNYQLDTQAQNFRLKRTKTIATVYPYNGPSKRLISDPFYMELTGAITDELAEYDYDMLIARVPTFDPSWCDRYILNKRVDGILMVDSGLEDQGIARLQALGAAFVVWNPQVENQDFVSVGCDSIGGARRAVEHLYRLGRRRIAFVGGNSAMVETYLRRVGYEAGLAVCGLPLDPALILYTDFTPQQGHLAIKTLLAQQPQLDAIFFCSDVLAMAAMEELRGQGRRVPEDVSVVGYDDIPLAAHCTPRLTTVRQHIHEGGRLMVQKLFALLDGQAVESALLPSELIVRDSCGA
jgi:DNA-binding LacI/PurR family transcriptional regulator